MLRIFVGSAPWRKEIAWQLQPVRFDVQRVCSDINPGISTRGRYSSHHDELMLHGATSMI